MQINAFGGKSGQVTEDYMLSGTCIYSFFPVFFPFALSLRAYEHVSVCESVFVRISTLVYVFTCIVWTSNKCVRTYTYTRDIRTRVYVHWHTYIYVQFEAGHETFTKSIWNLYCISRQLAARQPAETSIVFLRANLNLDCLILVQYNIDIVACLTFFDYRSSARAASFRLFSIRFTSRRFVGHELAERGVYYRRSSPYLCCTVKRTLGSFRDEIERDKER